MEPQESHTSHHISESVKARGEKKESALHRVSDMFVLDYDCGKQ